MPGPDPYASMPHRPDCGRGPHCECDPPDEDEYDEPNDGYDHDAIYEMVANAELMKRQHEHGMTPVALDQYLRSEAEQAVISETRAKGIVVPEHYEPASPRYAIAYWLAAMQSELLCAELAAADCMDDADDLIADLAAVGLTIVRTATP